MASCPREWSRAILARGGNRSCRCQTALRGRTASLPRIGRLGHEASEAGAIPLARFALGAFDLFAHEGVEPVARVIAEDRRTLGFELTRAAVVSFEGDVALPASWALGVVFTHAWEAWARVISIAKVDSDGGRSTRGFANAIPDTAMTVAAARQAALFAADDVLAGIQWADTARLAPRVAASLVQGLARAICVLS